VSPAREPGPLGLFATVGRIHIVAIATLGTFTFGWLFLGTRPWLLAAISGFDWFLVNLLNRAVDIPEDEANGIPGTSFVARNRRAIVVLGFALLLGSLALAFPFVPEITPFRVAFHALGLAYNWPLFPGGRRLKQLYFWKNTASATGFLLTVFGYPLAALAWQKGLAGLPPGMTIPGIVAAAVFFFAFELSYEVIYDLRDARGDAASGVRTYPVVHGERIAVRIVDGLLLLATLVLVLSYGLGLVPWRIAVMAAAPALQVVVYKRALRRGITSRDCIVLTWLGALLLLAYHGWIWAGLPGVT
jgi:4-hydroxybenzoate polyprenyltransferase